MVESFRGTERSLTRGFEPLLVSLEISLLVWLSCPVLKTTLGEPWILDFLPFPWPSPTCLAVPLCLPYVILNAYCSLASYIIDGCPCTSISCWLPINCDYLTPFWCSKVLSSKSGKLLLIPQDIAQLYFLWRLTNAMIMEMLFFSFSVFHCTGYKALWWRLLNSVLS